jgi:hypothetical protein
VNTQEAAALLGIAAAFDNRKPDADAAKAWSVALDGFRFEDCRDVIVAHYRGSSDWLMPSHIIAGVKRIRAKRIADVGDLTPPDFNPAGDPLLELSALARERAWFADMRRRIGDGEQVVTDARGITQARNMPDLLAITSRVDNEQEAS